MSSGDIYICARAGLVRTHMEARLKRANRQGLQGQRGVAAAAGPLRRDVQSLQAANTAMVDAVNADVSRELQQVLGSLAVLVQKYKY